MCSMKTTYFQTKKKDDKSHIFITSTHYADMAIKNNKFKNTGILFELCVRQITSDLLNNRDSKASKIFKKYFTGTELGSEYSLYSAFVESPKLNETKSEILISTILEQQKKLDQEKLRKLKYNLIREIKSNYDLEDFFKAKISNYKLYAAVYSLFEAQNENSVKNTKVILSNKMTILEHLTKEQTSKKPQDEIVDDLIKEDREVRLLTYKMIVEKFNSKYSSLSDRQKSILQEYIYNITDTKNLKVFVNEQFNQIKSELVEIHSGIKDPVLKIKVKEVTKLIKPLKENESIKDETMAGLLQYIELIEELKSRNK